MRGWLLALAATAALAACEEELTVPGQCPELCPGGEPAVYDTVIPAIVGSDTTFFGYSSRSDVSSLLISDGMAAGEARAWVRFPKRLDSVTVLDTARGFIHDSVVFTFNLVVRDTLVKGVRLIVHRAPLTWDTLTTFSEVDAALTPDAIIDSVGIVDSLRSGPFRLVITDSAAMANLIPAADSGHLALGLRVRADSATGVRLGSIAGASGSVTFATFGKAAGITDTTRVKQVITLTAEANNFVRNRGTDTPDVDLLYAGRVPAARTILRFVVPDVIKDSTVRLVRATLQLSPAEPLTGLPDDPATIDIQSVNMDIGAKSPVNIVGSNALLPSDGSTSLFGVDLRSVVERWRGVKPLPPTIVFGLSPQGGSFALPVFYSTRSAEGLRPRLRITYVLPSAVERP